MGWLWGSGDDAPASDPYAKLDPALREFLERESPLKYHDTKPKSPNARAAPSSDAAPNTYRSQLDRSTSNSDHSDLANDRPTVPPESLFQDGRYAHLWKNYRPQGEIEAVGSTDQDRMADVIKAYNDRKVEIGRAALENCVEYQIAEKDCFSNGGFSKVMTMCRDENRAFNRCYSMQSRFLKALGYLAMQRTAEEEERIQLHADKLYNEMLERERISKEAKEQGLEAPELPPLIQTETTTKALGEDSAWARARNRAIENGMPNNNLSSYSPEKQEEIKQRIKGLSKDQKALELQLIAAEERAKLEYADQIRDRMEEEKAHREDRRARGKETMGDTIKRMWGWDK